MREESEPLPPLLYSPRILVFPTFPHSLHSFLLSRILTPVIVSDNPSTTPKHNTTQQKNHNMRKITKQATDAFHNEQDFRSGNTQVNRRLGGVELTLHGHIIAKNISGDGLYINLCGWNTNTTRDRLNGLQGVRLHTRKGQAFLNDKPISSCEWVKVS